MSNVNSQLFITMFIILLGYIVKRLNIITEKDGQSIAKVVFNITLPALIITTFSSIKIDYSLGLVSLINILYNFFMIALMFILFRKSSRTEKGMYSTILPSFNIGLFAFPIIDAIWGQASIKYLAMFDIGNAFIIFVVVYLLASYLSTNESKIEFKSIFKKLTSSVPLMVYLISIILNISGVKLPSFIIDVSGIIAKANMPLSLLVLGIYLSFNFEKYYFKNMLKVLAIRYITGLTVGIILFFILPFEPMLRYTLLIGLILPISLTAIPYSVQFNYNSKFVGTTANLTNVISFVIMWIIFAIAKL